MCFTSARALLLLQGVLLLDLADLPTAPCMKHRCKSMRAARSPVSGVTCAGGGAPNQK
jgi:hypothetical protein